MSRWAGKYVIGLTGNIATGKSVVRQMLQHLGAYPIDADSLTHRAMAPGAPAYRPIVEKFGQFILDADKNIDRTMLGNIVFSRPDALAALEAIVHPVVEQAIGVFITRATQPVIVIEAIKLLEGDLVKAVDEVWVVDASLETQFKRLVGPRKMSEADAKQRIVAQGPQAEKLKKANVIIKNDGNVEETWKQVQTAWTNIQKKIGAPAPVSPEPVVVAETPKPVAPPPAPSTPTAATPTPVAPPPSTTAPVTASDVKISVKRGMPSNAEAIANFINASAAKSVNRMDIMMAFGQKSYLLAQDTGDKVLGVLGWQVENLITRVDEFYLAADAPVIPVVEGLVTAIEAASKDLQSEVAYIFLMPTSSADTVQTFLKSGYEATSIEQIKIPAWREAVQEILADNKNARILSKKLREDRVLKPI